MTPSRTAPARTRLAVLVAGAVFFTSGVSLVVHILTGAPLPLVLAVVLILATVAVGVAVWSEPRTRGRWVSRIAVGAPVGVVATLAYDGSRLLLVEVGGLEASPFAAFPLFGQALLMADSVSPASAGLGVAFHLLNGVAFGCAYAVWFGHRPWWWGIGFALGLEAFMLAIYPGWLDLRSVQEFTAMSVLGHLAYGTVLGAGTSTLIRRHARRSERSGSGVG